MRYRIIVTALVLFIFVAFFSCAGGNKIKILSHDMTVHEFAGSSSQSMAVVYGRAQNIADDIMSNATITVTFYDKNKKVIATGSTVKQNLQPSEVWDFSIQTVGPDAWKIVSYDIYADAR